MAATDTPALATPALTSAATFAASSLCAGACIGIAAMTYLRLGGLEGCVLFALGLMAVVFFDLRLFTGRSQFAWGRPDPADPRALGYGALAAMLFFNIIGCAAMTLIADRSGWAIDPGTIVMKRFNDGALLSGLRAIPCGFIMTLAVRSAKASVWWPLLFGVPTFIICGFPHCVADVFYYAAAPQPIFDMPLHMTVVYLATVAGNYIGCNIYRAFSERV